MDEHTFLGLVAEFLIAGFSGGYVYAFFMHKNTPREIIGSVISGGFVGNYAVSLIALKFSIPLLPAAFFAGLAWNAICHQVLDHAAKGRRDDR